MDSREILATNLRSLMKKAGINSQENLATVTGISQTQIGNILNQKKGASIDTLERLAEGLKCESWLLLAPMINLERYELTDFMPLVHCYMRLPFDDQNSVWKLTHRLYESVHESQFIHW